MIEKGGNLFGQVERVNFHIIIIGVAHTEYTYIVKV